MDEQSVKTIGGPSGRDGRGPIHITPLTLDDDLDALGQMLLASYVALPGYPPDRSQLDARQSWFRPGSGVAARR